MRGDTVRALTRLNQAFYGYYSEEFDRSRSEPWPGWVRVAEALQRQLAAQAADPRPPRIMDVGCGNGRFGLFLEDRLTRPFDYLGVDLPGRLLDAARSRLAQSPLGGRRFLPLDLASEGGADALPPALNSMVAVFGLMHHIPGLDRRRELLRGLRARLTPGGLLAVSFWQFGALDRFRRRLVPWQEHNRRSAAPVDEDDLEPGDHLLAWGKEPGVYRYCNYTDPDAADRLVSAAGFELLDRYRADGASGELNLYFLLTRR